MWQKEESSRVIKWMKALSCNLDRRDMRIIDILHGSQMLSANSLLKWFRISIQQTYRSSCASMVHINWTLSDMYINNELVADLEYQFNTHQIKHFSELMGSPIFMPIYVFCASYYFESSFNPSFITFWDSKMFFEAKLVFLNFARHFWNMLPPTVSLV